MTAATLTHEQTINTALGEVLNDFGQEWRIRAEHVGRIFEEGGRPDILIEKPDGWPDCTGSRSRQSSTSRN